MAQLILAIHTGSHDAAAAVFEDYSLRAAVSLERLTRHKNDGRTYPEPASTRCSPSPAPRGRTST
jgi:carbamoyltransferase